MVEVLLALAGLKPSPPGAGTVERGSTVLEQHVHEHGIGGLDHQRARRRPCWIEVLVHAVLCTIATSPAFQS